MAEGSPVLAGLFNVFIDPIAVKLKVIAAGVWANPLNLFTDNIVQMSPTALDMKRLLDLCGTSAASHGLTWGMDKCHALVAQGHFPAPLYLNDSELTYVQHADYLGVDKSATGVTAAKTIEGLCRAEARIRKLKRAGLRPPRLSATRLRALYMALLRPAWTYCLQLTPLTYEVLEKATKLGETATSWLIPWLALHSRIRAWRLLALEDADVRRHVQMQSMIGSLRDVREEEANNGLADAMEATVGDIHTALALNDLYSSLPPHYIQLARWEVVEARKTRR